MPGGAKRPGGDRTTHPALERELLQPRPGTASSACRLSTVARRQPRFLCDPERAAPAAPGATTAARQAARGVVVVDVVVLGRRQRAAPGREGVWDGGARQKTATDGPGACGRVCMRGQRAFQPGCMGKLHPRRAFPHDPHPLLPLPRRLPVLTSSSHAASRSASCSDLSRCTESIVGTANAAPSQHLASTQPAPSRRPASSFARTAADMHITQTFTSSRRVTARHPAAPW
ncbi:hypothetical protein PSPO01_09879 [Paraphaeosphaeria sporulosa]